MLLNEFLKQHGHIADLDKEQQTQLAALRNENTKLRAENAANAKRLAALETRDKEREARLTRLEIATPGARPVSNSIVDNNAANEK
jgi:septal ring factor EnvC (AmiA/AmiB activator)